MSVLESGSQVWFQANESVSELEKLRLANQLANAILPKRSNNDALPENVIENTEGTSKACNRVTVDCNWPAMESHLENNPVHTTKPSSDGSFSVNSKTTSCNNPATCENESSEPGFKLSSDIWGINQYLQDENQFRYVADYLSRTERLLNMTTKPVSIPSSYKVVSSTEQLLRKPATENSSPKESLSSDDICQIQGKCIRTAWENNTDDNTNSTSRTKAEMLPDSSLTLGDNQLKTHRPNISTDQFPVFNPHYSLIEASFDDEKPDEDQVRLCSMQNFFAEETEDHFGPDEPVHEVIKKSEDQIKHKPSLTFCRREKLNFLPGKEGDAEEAKTNAFKDTASSSATEPPVECCGALPSPEQKDDLVSRMMTSAMPSSPVLENILAENNVETSVNQERESIKHKKNLADTRSKESPTASQLNLTRKNFANAVTSVDEVDKPPVNTVPKLQFENENKRHTKYPYFSTKKQLASQYPPNKVPLQIITQSLRPQSAGSLSKNTQGKIERSANSITAEKCRSSSPTKSRRPASAGKLSDDAEVNGSPKRRWEKSSIAWSSYGRRQLRTWSSIPPVKLPTAREISANEIVHNRRDKERSAVNLLSASKILITNVTILDLPDEIFIHIFNFLPAKELFNVAKVCKRFNQVSLDRLLWKSVNVSDIAVSDRWFAAIGTRNPKQLSLSNCSGNAVTNKGLRLFFKNCKVTLNTLHVGNCSGESLCGDTLLLYASCHCRNLRHVSVPWSKTTDNGTMAISYALPVMETLNINGNSSITDDALNVLRERHGKNLKSLEMSGCFAVSCDTLLSLIKETRSLLLLNVGLCSKITSECVITMSEHLHSLRHLDLHGVKSVTNRCVHFIARHCKNLKTLILSNCNAVCDVGMAEIATYLNTLTHLDVSGCPSISDKGITNFLSVANSVEHLDLSGTSATHVSVSVLTSCNFQTISTLKLSFCHNITQSCIGDLLKCASRLKSLHLYGCKRLKVSVLIKLNRDVLLEA